MGICKRVVGNMLGPHPKKDVYVKNMAMSYAIKIKKPEEEKWKFIYDSSTEEPILLNTKKQTKRIIKDFKEDNPEDNYKYKVYKTRGYRFNSLK